MKNFPLGGPEHRVIVDFAKYDLLFERQTSFFSEMKRAIRNASVVIAAHRIVITVIENGGALHLHLSQQARQDPVILKL